MSSFSIRSSQVALAAVISLLGRAALAQTPAAQGPNSAASPTPAAAPSALPPDTNPSPELPSAGPVLPLAQALRTALERHPSLRQADASARAAEARVDVAFAPILPTVTGIASYARNTANSPSSTQQNGAIARGSNFDTYGFWNFGINASLVVFDFGQARGNLHSAEANAEVSRLAERAQRINVALAVRDSYFQARAQKALLLVAVETLKNQARHLAQIRGFFELGTRPRIDLVQTQTDLASAELSRVNAENAYAIAKAQLVQAMGLESAPPFEVSDETLAPLENEDFEPNRLYAQALAARPDVLAALGSVRAQQLSVSALKGAYGPTLKVSTGFTETGEALDNLRWNWNAQATLNWPIFEGGVTKARVREANANVDVASAQVNVIRQQVLLAVEQARIGVLGAKRALATADILVQNARERLTLAEGRYQTGVGNVIEQGDAQLALTSAQQQRVQAEFNLSTARAALMNALGSQ